eukprot:scaffold11465_cov105-Isochrysis_galbana.AAC.10
MGPSTGVNGPIHGCEYIPAERDGLIDWALLGQLLLEPPRVLIRLRIAFLRRNFPRYEQIVPIVSRLRAPVPSTFLLLGRLDGKGSAQLLLLRVVGQLPALPGACGAPDGPAPPLGIAAPVAIAASSTV